MNNIKLAIYFISMGLAIGFTLVVYAHAQFASKSTVERMDDRIWEIHQVIVRK